jgi:hypothetical protein
MKNVGIPETPLDKERRSADAEAGGECGAVRDGRQLADVRLVIVEQSGCSSAHVLALERSVGRAERDGGEPDEHQGGGDAQPGAQLSIPDCPVEQ